MDIDKYLVRTADSLELQAGGATRFIPLSFGDLKDWIKWYGDALFKPSHVQQGGRFYALVMALCHLSVILPIIAGGAVILYGIGKISKRIAAAMKKAGKKTDPKGDPEVELAKARTIIEPALDQLSDSEKEQLVSHLSTVK